LSTEEYYKLTDRERDALVAEMVMGKCAHKWSWDDSVEVSPEPGWLYCNEEDYRPDYAWKCERCGETKTADYPSLTPQDGAGLYGLTTTWTGMEQVVEAMEKNDWGLVLQQVPKGWSADFWYDGDEYYASAHADTAPAAVAEAALKALGVIK